MATNESLPSNGRKNLVCFVIGPVGDPLADDGTEGRLLFEQAMKVLEDVIEPACATFGISPLRADQMSQPGEIPEQIFELLRDAHLVIADLTDGNPNVMYELGLRHSTGKCTIQLVEHGKIPFDVSAIRSILFKRSVSSLAEAREQLKKSIADCLEGRHNPVTASRVMLGALPVSSRQVSSESEEVASEPQEEAGVLEKLALTETALPEIVNILNGTSAQMETVTRLFTEATDEVNRSDDRGAGAKGRLSIAARLSGDLTPIAGKLEDLAETYERNLIDAEAGMDLLLEAIEKEDRPQALLDLAASILNAAEQVRENNQRSETTARVIGELGQISRTLRSPSRRIAASLRRIAAASSRILVWAERARGVLESTGQSDGAAGSEK